MNNAAYTVERIQEVSLDITGLAEASPWYNANELTHFVSPWDDKPIKPITFKALYDETYLYFSFVVLDDSIYIQLNDDSKESIAQSDRVELFLRPDESLSPYYCLEIDTQPRIMDFKAMPNRDFDLKWNWPKYEIQVKSAIL